MEKDFYTTAELARILRVSRVTVFKKVKNGEIKARKMGRNFVIFKKDIGDMESLMSSLFKMAKEWAISKKEFPEEFYCPNSAVFQARLTKMEMLMARDKNSQKIFSLLTSIAGEIGNNSFDHNLGKWPDEPGIFFGYNLDKRQIMLADRGVGILETLKRVKPQLGNHKEALETAFTEIISGRKPESRGNGLKYVRSVVAKYPINLLFQTGDAKLILNGCSSEINIKNTAENLRGCLAFIAY